MSTAVAPPRPGAASVAATVTWLISGNPLRWVFALYPVLMAVTVPATGNHDFLDSVAGVVVVLTALLAICLFNRKER